MTRIIAALAAGALLSTTALASPRPVGIITGMVSGTYAATGANLELLDSDALRVEVILGRGSLKNLDDLLHLRGVDVAFVQGDALDYARAHSLFPAPQLGQLQYVSKLYDEEIHVIARSSVNSVADLTGKRVNVDVSGSGSAMTAEIVFAALGVKPEITNQPQAVAVEALKNGQIDAIFHVGGAPIPLLKNIPEGSDLHAVPVPLTDQLAQTYIPGEMTHDEYPNLIPAGAPPIATIAVSDVLAVFGWPAGSDRAAGLNVFVDALFGHIEDLQQPPNHPKWREVNLAATVPGWTRYPEAIADLTALKQQAAFRQFMEQNKEVPPDMADHLFQQFLAWQRQHAEGRR